MKTSKHTNAEICLFKEFDYKEWFVFFFVPLAVAKLAVERSVSVQHTAQ